MVEAAIEQDVAQRKQSANLMLAHVSGFRAKRFNARQMIKMIVGESARFNEFEGQEDIIAESRARAERFLSEQKATRAEVASGQDR